MSDDLYILIPGWREFQHYKHRDPTWIKNYPRLLSHDAYSDLTFAQRGILHGLWMEYARSQRRLRGDTATLTRRLGQRVTKRDIERLNHAGFIQLIASAQLEESASPETDKEKEIDKEEDLGCNATDVVDDLDAILNPNGNTDVFDIRKITPELRSM